MNIIFSQFIICKVNPCRRAYKINIVINMYVICDIDYQRC